MNHYLRGRCLHQHTHNAPVLIVDHQWFIAESLWHLDLHDEMLLRWRSIGTLCCGHLVAPVVQVRHDLSRQFHSLVLGPCLFAVSLVSGPGLLEAGV